MSARQFLIWIAYLVVALIAVLGVLEWDERPDGVLGFVLGLALYGAYSLGRRHGGAA